MNYRLLNEVLIEWNESSKQDSDNIFLKSGDIKESLDRYFVYRLDKKDQIKIFNADWLELEKYRNKVWINGKHVELDNRGCTDNEFEQGEYRVYIKDIDKVTDMSYMFFNCKQLVSAFIPTGVEIILGEYTFGNCSFLQNVFIPDSVKIIDNGVFYHCVGLTSITIPNSVTVVGGFAFAECACLTSVTIPNSVTSIGIWAFCDCSGLTSVTIPSSVTSIGYSAFFGCRNLKTVYVEDINRFNQIEFKNKWSDPRYYGAKLIELKK